MEKTSESLIRIPNKLSNEEIKKLIVIVAQDFDRSLAASRPL